MDTGLTDQIVRGLLSAMQEDLRAHLGGSLEPDLVSELYVRLRAVLRERQLAGEPDPAERDEVVDDLAMTVYLVVAARKPADGRAPDLLLPLRRVIAKSLGSSGPRDRAGVAAADAKEFKTTKGRSER